MLFDAKQPYEMHFAGPANLVTLQLPVDWAASWLTDPMAQCGRRIDAASGWGQPLSSFVQQLTPEVAARPPLPVKLMTDQLGSLLALGTNDFAAHASESASTVAAFVRKATEFLQERYAEHGLTAQAIAQDLHISERTLHRHFARSGGTFLQHLIKHRMAVAERMLRDPRFDRLTVSEVGRRVGLADTSHFIRQCRASLGSTPASLRRAR
jgi:AraC-like DNA-binding protein